MSKKHIMLIISAITLIVYFGVLGYSVDNRILDIIANLTISISIFIWVYIDSNDKDIYFGKIQNFLFIIPLTNPFITIWYLVKTRKTRTGIFYVKMAVYAFSVFLLGIFTAITVAYISTQ